ncbi:MAG: hypothetical protein NZM37_06475 [Sandaracinaceae bacterium]|nr:hypothetical protein [Sandaracinaceae bacterium]
MGSPYLRVHEVIDAEIAHHYDPGSGTILLSRAHRFWGKIRGRSFAFSLPASRLHPIFASTRLLRRLTRTDKSSAVFNAEGDGIVVIYRGVVFFYDLKKERLSEAACLWRSRNVLHCGIAVTRAGIFFGEYDANPRREEVPIWASYDDGRSFQSIYVFPPHHIRHVHGIYADPFSPSLWITSGDLEGECYLFEASDKGFHSLTRHGDGSQRWRTVALLFEPDALIWIMDSQFQVPHLQRWKRGQSSLEEGQAFPGPVWYIKRFLDGSAVAQTTVELGPGCTSRSAHLWVSHNLWDWQMIASYEKDPWPMPWFKFGVIAFAEGPQPPDDFLIHGEALRHLDGKVLRVGIVS